MPSRVISGHVCLVRSYRVRCVCLGADGGLLEGSKSRAYHSLVSLELLGVENQLVQLLRDADHRALGIKAKIHSDACQVGASLAESLALVGAARATHTSSPIWYGMVCIRQATCV